MTTDAQGAAHPSARDVMKSGSPPRNRTLSGSVALITRGAINEPDVLGKVLDCNIAYSYRYWMPSTVIVPWPAAPVIVLFATPGRARPDARFEA